MTNQHNIDDKQKNNVNMTINNEKQARQEQNDHGPSEAPALAVDVRIQSWQYWK